METKLDSTTDSNYISHNELIKFTRALGYRAHDGMCYGFIGAALIPIFKGNWHILNSYLLHMKTLYDMHNVSAEGQRLQQFFKTALKKPSEIPSQDYHIIADLKPFCELMEFIFQPEYYTEFFPEGRAVYGQNIAKILEFILPAEGDSVTKETANQNKSKIVATKPFTGIYDHPELTDLLSSLFALLSKKNERIVLLVSSTSHSMLVVYEPGIKKWVIIDLLKAPFAPLDSHADVAKDIISVMSLNKNTALSTQIFGLDQEHIDSVLTQWKNTEVWQRLHSNHMDKMVRLDCKGRTWLHVAAQNNDIEAIGQMPINLVSSLIGLEDDDGYNPLQCAAAEGHIEAFKLLLPHSAGLVEELVIDPGYPNAKVIRELITNFQQQLSETVNTHCSV